MPNNENNGRPVKRIWFMNECGDHTIFQGEGRYLHYYEIFHGDHDECWVIESNGSHEVARHNARFIATIEWAD